jgi:integrase
MRTPSLRRHKTGQAFVVINRKHHYLGKWGSDESEAEYRRLVGEYLACGHKDVFRLPVDSITVAALCTTYFEHCLGYYQDKESNRIKVAIRPLVELYGDTLAKDFAPHHLKAVRQSIVDGKYFDERKRENIPTRTYVNTIVKCIRRMFRWASGEGMLPPSIHQALADLAPLKRGRTTAREPEKIKPVDPATVQQTIERLPPVLADMIRFQSLVGCRPGEVCDIQPCMVDRSVGDVWEIKLDAHKTAWRGTERILYIGPKAQAILTPYLDRDPCAYCFSPIEAFHQRRPRIVPKSCGNGIGKSNHTPKTSRQISDHYNTHSYGRAIARVCEENNIPRWSPNQLRHAAATNVRRVIGLEAASAILGHSQITTTQIYAEASRELAINTAKRLG